MSAITNIEQIINDKTSGSSELLDKLNKLLLANLNNSKKFNNILDNTYAKLLHFSNIANFIKTIKTIKSTSKLKEYLNSYQSINNYDLLYDKAKLILLKYNSLTTLSNSLTLYEILIRFYKDNNRLVVNIAESRPMLEGRIMAKRLLKEGIKVNLFIDALLPQYIEKSDAVVIGADSILKDGSVVNKVGSRFASITANYYNKSFYVISLKTKR